MEKMQIKELIKNGIIENLKVTKKTYSKNNLVYKIKSNVFLKVSEKNIFKALNFIKSFNSSLINIDCNNYILEYNKSKTDYKQLLITNDKNLCIDAFNLNTLNSCKGQQIMVCYINKNGKLHKGITEPLEKRENKTVEAYENSFADRTEELPGTPAKNTIKNCFFGACLLLVGFGLGKIVK